MFLNFLCCIEIFSSKVRQNIIFFRNMKSLFHKSPYSSNLRYEASHPYMCWNQCSLPFKLELMRFDCFSHLIRCQFREWQKDPTCKNGKRLRAKNGGEKVKSRKKIRLFYFPTHLIFAKIKRNQVFHGFKNAN